MSFNLAQQPMERVLVIDDDVGLCELVGEYLEPEGYTVEAIHNGERGIDRALSDEHDLVFATCLRREPQTGSNFRSVTVPRASVRRIVSLWYAVPVGFATQTEFTMCSAR